MNYMNLKIYFHVTFMCPLSWENKRMDAEKKKGNEAQ